MTTNVVFRKFSDGEVIALFPHEPSNDSFEVMSYLHNGQHGSASRDIAKITTLATEEEYKDLLNELQIVGYQNLNVVKRLSNRS